MITPELRQSFEEKFDCTEPKLPPEYIQMPSQLKEDVLSFISEREALARWKYREALIWCSGSEDFQIGGKAREGWEKLCMPLLTPEHKPSEN